MDEAIAGGLIGRRYNRRMSRLLRIFVLVLAVMPLAMPGVRWSASAQCMTQMNAAASAEHLCCPQHAAMAAPACCNAKADSNPAESRAMADEARIGAAPQVMLPAPLRMRAGAARNAGQRTAYISILLPALILRT